MREVAISICIPAYKNVHFLKRLFESISIQSFKDFEVVVSDDSPDDAVARLCKEYSKAFRMAYVKNTIPLGTPENWNNAIRMAKGKWIKLIHDDDWFSDSQSLVTFHQATMEHPDCHFFFCSYVNIYEDSGKKQQMGVNKFWKNWLYKKRNILIADNVIGPPSVTMYKNEPGIIYDKAMKYVVDIDFYIRYLEKNRFFFIPDPLINVGINSAQVTKYTFGVANVHLKESLMLLRKTGDQSLRHIVVYDGWWRLIRNFSIKKTEDILITGYDGAIPDRLKNIINFQKNIPASVLKNGFFSKVLMATSFLKQALKSKTS